MIHHVYILGPLDPRSPESASAGIVIAGCIDDGNPFGREALHLFDEKGLRRHAQPVIVKQVPRNEDGTDVFVKGTVDGPSKSSSKRLPQMLSKGGRSSVECRVEVYVRKM